MLVLQGEREPANVVGPRRHRRIEDLAHLCQLAGGHAHDVVHGIPGYRRPAIRPRFAVDRVDRVADRLQVRLGSERLADGVEDGFEALGIFACSFLGGLRLGQHAEIDLCAIGLRGRGRVAGDANEPGGVLALWLGGGTDRASENDRSGEPAFFRCRHPALLLRCAAACNKA